MVKLYTLALIVLVLGLAPEMILGEEARNELAERKHQQRSYDTYKIFNRKRNAHACIMSIVFIVLYPLGAISLHLPIHQIPYLKNTYLKNKVMTMHTPIQAIAFVMMIGGMALGIRIGHDLNYLQHPVHAHVVIGLLTVSTIIVFQPVLGLLQHQHFKKTGHKSIFAYLHRWLGRGAIVLGMINSGLGFQLARANVIIHKHSYVRNYTILGILVSIWVGFVIYDEFRLHGSKVPNGLEEDVLDETRTALKNDASVNRGSVTSK